MRKDKFRIITLSVNLVENKTVVIGFQFSGMNNEDRNKLLGIAFIKDATTNQSWKIHKISLGPYVNKFTEPKEQLLDIFKPFLYTLELHLPKKNIHLRKENNQWKIKKKVQHSFQPNFELPLDDLDNTGKKIEYIIKLCEL